MGTFYEIDGSIELQKSKAAKGALEELERACSGYEHNLTVHETGRTLALHFSLADYCGYGTAEEIDSALQAIGPYALAAAQFAHDAEGERGVLWVGPDEATLQAAKSRAALDEIMQLIEELQPADVLRLKELLAASRRSLPITSLTP